MTYAPGDPLKGTPLGAPTDDLVVSARQRHNILVRHRGDHKHPDVVQARRELEQLHAEAEVIYFVGKIAERAEDLTDEQVERLRALLPPLPPDAA